MKSLEKVILDVLETKQPRNVKELGQLVQEQVDATLEDIEKEVQTQRCTGPFPSYGGPDFCL